MRLIAAGLMVMGFVGVVGCQGEASTETTDAMDRRVEPAPRPHQDMYNQSQLDTFPLEVRTAFRRDFPNSGVSSASVQSTETGPGLYRIVFIQNGQAREVTYDRLGTVVSAPPQPQNPNASRPGFPAPQPQQAPPPPNPSAAPMTPAPAQ